MNIIYNSAEPVNVFPYSVIFFGDPSRRIIRLIAPMR